MNDKVISKPTMITLQDGTVVHIILMGEQGSAAKISTASVEYFNDGATVRVSVDYGVKNE